MFIDVFLPLLSLGTLLAVVIFAYLSQQKVMARMDDDKARKSTLAADKAADGKPADV